MVVLYFLRMILIENPLFLNDFSERVPGSFEK
jgi:hypothetical protein